jgi:hypothetical protein
MGLIISSANEAIVSCELYRRYFQENFGAMETGK